MFMKKTEFWTLKVLLALLFMCSTQILYAYDCFVDGIFYDLNETEQTATVTYRQSSGSGYGGVVDIPSEIQYNNVTYTVTSIGYHAFWWCSVTSVTIPNTVVSIGEGAFLHCEKLTSISIPSSVASIENYTFRDCI